MSNRKILIAIAAASCTVAACNADKAGGNGSATTSGPVEPVAPPANGDWSTVVSKTAEGGFLMGNPNADVKVVEFASMTCPHCAEFEEQAMKPLTENYVKSGRVSFEFRNFVRDPFDVAASLVARCGGTTSFFGLTRGLFADQEQWFAKVQSADPAAMQQIQSLPPNQQFAEIARVAGFQEWAALRGLSPEKTAACLADQAEVDRLVQMQNDAVSAYDIAGTPSFLLNGELVPIEAGSTPWQQLESRLKAALGN